MSHGSQPGRPPIAQELRQLIRRMWEANPTWGSPRVVAELRKLDIETAKSAAKKYEHRSDRPPFTTWRTFLKQQAKDIAAIDFLVVPTVSFKMLFAFALLAHNRRRIVYFNATEHPAAQMTARQVVEAFPFDTAPPYLLLDGDGISGNPVRRKLEYLRIDEVVTAPASAWQTAYAERMFGSLRRELLDHVLVLNERHLKRLLSSYFEYYHPWRTHRSLDQDIPDGRRVLPAEPGQVVELPRVQGAGNRHHPPHLLLS